MAKKMVFVDTSLCTGCKACSVACKVWNELPAEQTKLITSYQIHSDFTPQTWTYMTFTELYEEQKMKWLTRKAQCFHCAEPWCAKACPKKAIYQTDSGYVEIDHELCVGCGYCTANCPFGVPKVNQETQKSVKCTGCIERVENGLLPSCVNTCGPGALTFGDRDAMLDKANARLAVVQKTNPKAQLYGVTEMGGTTFCYLLMDSPEVYNLPANPKMPLSLIFWKDVVHPVGKFIMGAAASAVAVGVVVNFIKGNYRKDDHDSQQGGSH